MDLFMYGHGGCGRFVKRATGARGNDGLERGANQRLAVIAVFGDSQF